jgi:hypothetical protein
MHHLERGLQGQLDELNLMIEEKNERVSSLEGESYELHQQVQECELRLLSAESARADLEARVAEYKALWQEGAEKNQSMALAIEAKDERSSALRAENHELQLRVQEYELRHSSHENELRIVQVHLEELKMLVQEKTEQVSILEGETHRLELKQQELSFVLCLQETSEAIAKIQQRAQHVSELGSMTSSKLSGADGPSSLLSAQEESLETAAAPGDHSALMAIIRDVVVKHVAQSASTPRTTCATLYDGLLQMDTDQNGQLKRSELARGLRSLGLALKQRELDAVFQVGPVRLRCTRPIFVQVMVAVPLQVMERDQ